MMGPELDRSMSPEALSSLFHQRPIRPLPKRRLRERLSPEVADSIEFPPASQQSSPLFLYPNIVREEPSPSPGRNYTVIRDQCYEDPAGTGGAEVGESDEEESKRFANSKVVRRSHPEILNRSANQPPKPGQAKLPSPQPPPSTTSSIDGYDSFENTNNKKKRKIPTAGDSGLNGLHSLSDLNSLSISTATSPPTETDTTGSVHSTYYSSAGLVGSTQGISGPGRGRFGRSRNGRSPLRALSDATNSQPGRGGKIKPPQWAESQSENTGIISSAIANAEKLPSANRQQNISLLHQNPATARARPASSQFTFTCDSQVPGTQWPGSDPIFPSYMGGRSKYPNMSAQGANDQNPTGNGHHDGSSAGSGDRHAAPKRKGGRRRGERELARAAKDRRRDAQYKLRNNPPKPEDFWICEFCEYERIFGEPPMALIRQYEIKDQKLRRQEQERKRLLEKAKAKSRKAKKNGKAAGKNSGTTQSHSHQGVHPDDCHGPSTTTDEEDEEEYVNGVGPEDGHYIDDDPPMILSDDPDVDPDPDDLRHRHVPGCQCSDSLPIPNMHHGAVVPPGSA